MNPSIDIPGSARVFMMSARIRVRTMASASVLALSLLAACTSGRGPAACTYGQASAACSSGRGPAAVVEESGTAAAIPAADVAVPGAAAPAATVAGLTPESYIPEELLPDAVQCMPAPPDADSPEFAYDRLRYEWGKRQREDPERLAMAMRDAIWDLDTTIAIMSTPFGLKVSAAETPHIYKVLTRGITTIEAIRFRPKAHYFRIRPFAFYGEPSIFPEDDDWLATEGSYPSGHTIRTWACALLMAEINPEAAEAVFARAWTAGENRVIAGCHWQSDVDASRPVASIGYARLQTSRGFRRDMARAQREFRRWRTG